MSKHLKQIALAAITVSPIALAAASAPALASPTLNFAIHTSQFSKPTMEFEYNGGNYVWKQQAINTQFSASANTNDNQLEWVGPLNVQTLGVGPSASFNGNVPNDVKSWSLKGPIDFPVNFLSSYQAGFASYCDANGVVGKPVANHNLSILFSVWQAYDEKTNNPGEVQPGADVYNGPRATKNINMPMTVVCGPKPAREVARPGGVKQETPDFKVKTIALNYGGAAPTKPNPTTSCKSAKLTVTFNTTKAGVVDFRLHKKIGNGPIQGQNKQVYAQFDGNAHFVASYHEYIQVSQLTVVQAMAEEKVNPIGLSTGWKDVTLRCENANGGYAGTPSNANPDGFPQSPQKPKRVFESKDGLVANPNGSVNPDGRNTPRPFKPVIAPATPIKTAPAPRVQRDSRFIGNGAQRVQ
jgi:hypothetical protein